MKVFLRRLLGATVLLLSAGMFVACGVGAVGVWVVRQDLSRRIEDLTARLDAGLGRASAMTQSVRQTTAAVREDVELGRKRPEDFQYGSTNRQMFFVYLRTVNQRLRRFSEAAPTVSTLLRTFQKLPFGPATRTNPDELDRSAERVSRLSAAIDKLQADLGDVGKELSDREMADTVDEAVAALETADALIGDWRNVLDTDRARLPGLGARLRGWLTLTSVAVTVVSLWVGLSQIGLFVIALKWCRAA